MEEEAAKERSGIAAGRKRALRRIDGLQPFHRQKNPQMHPLARLVSHTNHAKHRTPAVTAVRIAALYEDDRRPKSIGELPQRQEAPVRAGDVLCVTPLGAWVPVTLFPTVGINRPGTDEWPILLNELDEIATWVRTQAVPRLITGADPPTPTLPTRYAISVEHEDERHAIAAGSTTSAATRHAQRLGAASSRIDLIELLGSMGCSVDSAQIEAWLAQIPDHEVIERVSRLQATDGKDHATMQHNLRVLEQLRTEAVGFTG